MVCVVHVGTMAAVNVGLGSVICREGGVAALKQHSRCFDVVSLDGLPQMHRGSTQLLWLLGPFQHALACPIHINERSDAHAGVNTIYAALLCWLANDQHVLAALSGWLSLCIQ